MPEPTTTIAAAIAAGASTVTMALLGVDYYSLIWGMVGAFVALYQADSMGRVRSVIFVSLSTLVGAACGTAALAAIKSESRPLLMLFSLVVGFGSQAIITALLRAGLNRIEKLGGQ